MKKNSHTNLTDFLDTLGPEQNGRHIVDDILDCIFVNENICISNEI